MQKALLLNSKYGNFVVSDIPRESPGVGEVLIKVQSAALNPVDWKIQRFGYLIDGYPAVLGSDIAGDVVEVGEGVSDFQKGDRVFSQAVFKKTRGAFQQYVVASTSSLSKIPPKFSYDEVSTLPMALTTAFAGLYKDPDSGLGITPPITEEARGKYANTPIVILGGSSSVGQYVIQFAKLSGFSPIIVTASPSHTDSLLEIGASNVIDRNLSTSSLSEEIGKITSKPIHFVFDSIALAETQQTAIDIISPGGRAVVVLPAVVAPAEGKYLSKTNAGHVHPIPTFYREHLYGFLEKGFITPNRFEILPNGLAGIVEGLERLEANRVSRLKLVARPQETL
ncbi:Zinc-type alcohol dehydrogenase-like protein C2E1P3.01 [Psilocybe cubensis]|uniref:Zinc-type alcohol dehydrogenase-like protein C2E1P3.01 n=2 Tax=Psilocybe cubensis TaxID=181762 RepID=A0ACB8H039_PSICU|nr:Zinc-type alcohol dehydrogenase-like protein C2E1P3.01 [Psilocybe cubensis]KAH9481153.1 Zinc-type alcohol dehydrogenase-like protein C2E1P3.01 [Psilocybe cubensis]